MNDTDLSDNAATQFLLATPAGNDVIHPDKRAFATLIGMQMWREAARRCKEWEQKAYIEGWGDGANRGLRGYPENANEGYIEYKEYLDQERSKTAL